MNAPDAPVVIFIGQPNCGKSTLFNAVAGHKAQTSNFPGTTVKHTHSLVNIDGRLLNVIDLPGTYSLHPSDPAEKVALPPSLLGEAGHHHQRRGRLDPGPEPGADARAHRNGHAHGRRPEYDRSGRKEGDPVDAGKLANAARRSRHSDDRRPRPRAQRAFRSGLPLPGRRPVGARPCAGRATSRESSRDVTAALPADFPCIANRRFTAIQMIESGQLFCDEFLEDIHPELKAVLDERRAELDREARPAGL